MRTAKEYRRIAWNAIRPHWRVMLLISLAAVLPQLIEFFLQLLFGLIPPIDMQFWFSDPSRFLAAYDAFVVQTLAPNLLLNVLFNCLSVPLTLGLIGAAQRLLRGEDVQARHSLTYVPYSLRAIGLEIRIVLYAFWPLLALAAITLVLLLIFHSHGVYQLFCLASLAAIAFGVTRLYSMAAATCGWWRILFMCFRVRSLPSPARRSKIRSMDIWGSSAQSVLARRAPS